MAGHRLISWAIVMAAGAILMDAAAAHGAAPGSEGRVLALLSGSVLFISAVGFIVDYWRSWGADRK